MANKNTIAIVLAPAEAQSLADVSRQWRKGYTAASEQLSALNAVRAGAVAARRNRGDAVVNLHPDEAAALLTVSRGLRNNVRLSDNQDAALTKIRYALRLRQS